MNPARRGARGERRRRKSDAARYKRAAEAALEQVDACIRYLERIQKHQLAARLKKNRKWIHSLLDGPARRRS